MPVARVAAALALLALVAPATASADRLISPSGPTFTYVNPDTTSSVGNELVAFNGYVYFAADDNSGSGNELWRTDGTDGGTTRVGDINPGPGNSNPTVLTVVGNRLYFNANNGSGNSTTVMYIDTAAPNTIVTAKAQTAPVGGGAGFSTTAYGTLMSPVNGTALIGRYSDFVAPYNECGCYAVYALSGRSTDTFTKISQGFESVANGTATDPTVTAGGWTYYTRQNSNASPGQGAEPWRTNGTITQRVKDIVPGNGSSDPRGYMATSDRVYFLANDGTTGRELYVTDPAAAGPDNPTATKLLHSHQAGATSTDISAADAVSNGNVLYYVPDDDTTGKEVWRTDGTDAGTHVVKDLTPGTGGTGVNTLAPFGSGILWLRGYSDAFTSDGSDAGTTLMGSPGFDSYPGLGPAVVGGKAYFRGGFSPYGGVVWRTDGTPNGTLPLTAGAFDTSAKPGNPAATSFVALGSKLIFFAHPVAGTDALKVYAIDTTQPDAQRTNTALPTIGTALGGSRLDATDGTWSPPPATVSYQWLRNGQSIDGAPAKNSYYFPPDADKGQRFSVRVTTTGIGAPRELSAESAEVTFGSAAAGASPAPGAKPSPSPAPSTTTKPTPSASATPALTVKKKAKLGGKAKVGQKLKLTLPKFAQSGVKLSFSWYANSKRIKKQAKATLKLSRKQRGKKVTAKITVTKAGYKTLTLTVGPTKKVK